MDALAPSRIKSTVAEGGGSAAFDAEKKKIAKYSEISEKGYIYFNP